MILIITHKEDFTVDFIVQKLNDNKIPYYRLNCEDFFQKKYLSNNQSDFFFEIQNKLQFKSVWFRRTKLPDLDIENEGDKMFLLQDFETLFENLFLLIKTNKWLSNPQNVYRAENKLFQLQKAKEIGFIIPNTIITNNYEELEDFFKENDNNIIIKPIRQGRIWKKDGFETIFTNKLSLSQLKNIRDFELSPSIIQNYIDKEYELRVTVVDGEIFSAKINSQVSNLTKIDWRREKTDFEIYKLPESISEKCKTIVKKLGLSFGAIDLIKNKNGDYIFLEINPNGQWAWLEIENDLKISDAIINYLTK